MYWVSPVISFVSRELKKEIKAIMAMTAAISSRELPPRRPREGIARIGRLCATIVSFRLFGYRISVDPSGGPILQMGAFSNAGPVRIRPFHKNKYPRHEACRWNGFGFSH